MAIFSRRDVQSALDGLVRHLTPEQSDAVVRRLNANAAESVAAEWEVVVLAAFARCGRVAHERAFGGTTRPDLHFEASPPRQLMFVADVRTVSDANTNKENPYEDFYQAIRRVLVKQGHSSAGIDVRVESEAVGEYGNRKMKLLLPKKGNIDSFVKRELGDFLSSIACNPGKKEAFQYDQNGIRFKISYNPKETRFCGGGHISYTVPYSISRNPLTHALDEKRQQLSRSRFHGLRGIIVCDGSCEALREGSRINAAYGCQRIVEVFLHKHSSIHFVLVLRIEERTPPLGTTLITLVPKFFYNQDVAKSVRSELAIVIEGMLQHLPLPEDTPQNGLYWLTGRNKNIGRALGGFTMKDKSIKLSARAVTELLAGRIDQKRFLQENGMMGTELNDKPFSFFEQQLLAGRTIKRASVERQPHKDDDWIVFEFDGPDTAVSPYRIPC